MVQKSALSAQLAASHLLIRAMTCSRDDCICSLTVLTCSLTSVRRKKCMKPGIQVFPDWDHQEDKLEVSE
jgi:hypothetical protein